MITERAVEQRVKRILAKEEESLCRARPGSRMEIDYGRFYSVDLRTNSIRGAWRDVQALANEFEVLKPWEVLAS